MTDLICRFFPENRPSTILIYPGQMKSILISLAAVLLQSLVSCSGNSYKEREENAEEEKNERVRNFQGVKDEIPVIEQNIILDGDWVDLQHTPGNIIDSDEGDFAARERLINKILCDASMLIFKERLEKLTIRQLKTLSEYHYIYSNDILLKILLLQKEVFPDLRRVLDEEGIIDWGIFKRDLVCFVETVECSRERHRTLLALLAGLECEYFTGSMGMIPVFSSVGSVHYGTIRDDPIGLYTKTMTTLDLGQFEADILSSSIRRLYTIDILQMQPEYGFLLVYEPSCRMDLYNVHHTTLDQWVDHLFEQAFEFANREAFKLNLERFIGHKLKISRMSLDMSKIKFFNQAKSNKTIVEIANAATRGDCFLALILPHYWDYWELSESLLDSSWSPSQTTSLLHPIKPELGMFMAVDFQLVSFGIDHIKSLLGGFRQLLSLPVDPSDTKFSKICNNIEKHMEICHKPRSPASLGYLRKIIHCALQIDKNYDALEWENEMSKINLDDRQFVYILNNMSMKLEKHLSIFLHPRLFRGVLGNIKYCDDNPLWLSKEIRDIFLQEFRNKCTQDCCKQIENISLNSINRLLVKFYVSNNGRPIGTFKEDWEKIEKELSILSL